MTNKVAAGKIEQIVGVERHATEHWARAVSTEKRVYILHSQECKDHYPDLRLCPFSCALDSGIDEEAWIMDRPVAIRILEGRLSPKEDLAAVILEQLVEMREYALKIIKLHEETYETPEYVMMHEFVLAKAQLKLIDTLQSILVIPTQKEDFLGTYAMGRNEFRAEVWALVADQFEEEKTMCNTFEVWGFNASCEYELIYAGDSKENALSAFWRAPQDGYTCVKLEWRP